MSTLRFGLWPFLTVRQNKSTTGRIYWFFCCFFVRSVINVPNRADKNKNLIGFSNVGFGMMAIFRSTRTLYFGWDNSYDEQEHKKKPGIIQDSKKQWILHMFDTGFLPWKPDKNESQFCPKWVNVLRSTKLNKLMSEFCRPIRDDHLTKQKQKLSFVSVLSHHTKGRP